MALSKNISISNWKLGMKVSPYAGFSQFRGIDPHKVEGCASIEFAPTPVTFTVTQPGAINWTTTDKAGVVYFLDSGGKLFKTTDYITAVQITGNTTTNGTGNGLAYWKNYIFVARNQLVDVYLSPTWTSALATLAVSRSGVNPMFVGQDDVLYIGNGRYLASITEKANQTFNPADSNTFTFAATAVTLPQDYAIVSFSELGDRLMAGTIFGTASTNVKVSDVFPINRTDLSFSLPIRLDDEGINSLLTSNNVLYISSGLKGNLSVSNGVSVSSLPSIPLDTKKRDTSFWGIQVFPDAFDFWGDELLVGVSNLSSAGQTINPFGVYGLKDKTMRFLGNISAGKDGSDGTQVYITSVYAVSPSEFFVAWETLSGTTPLSNGVDYFTSATNRIGSYGAYMESEIYLVGSDREPATIEHFDFYLNKPLASGDGIRLSYRTSESGSYTTILTLDYATYSSINTYSFSFSIPDIKTIQFKVELTCTGTTSPELRAIIIS